MRIAIYCKTIEDDGEFFYYESETVPMVGDEISTDAEGQDHIWRLRVQSRSFTRIQGKKHNPYYVDNSVSLHCIDVDCGQA